ncbi:EamA family transporter [Nocardioides aurantiacus]|uniref:Putative membrane protein n=1 Tax=Nocardioides aurantiacus TaxID=86796 RepID=A0A3N2CV81_9ACTN|nr:EamA family transporter [Nocardioides aurantiacus]ROR91376.1 putative membrane protein [Nocardioides aurantiacus]
MTAVLLALASAAAYGTSDFVAGVASRRTSAWAVAVVGSAVGGLLALALALLLPGRPGVGDLAWGALAGVGNGLGGAFLYRGLSRGRMGVVGPVSAVGAAVLPVAVGVVGGERPDLLVWLGILVALPGIWLVAREPSAATAASPGAAALVDGLLAGAGFGLLFAAIGQVPDGAGYWPVAVSQAVAVLAVAALATTLGASWVPRDRAAVVGGAGAGALSAAAVVGFLLATQQGLLTVSAVLASLYPAVTVLLAAVLLHERVHRVQGAGLALCAVSVVCVAVG